MKSYSPEIDQLIARGLAGECTSEESGRLHDLLLGDPDLKADYELSKLLFLSRCKDFSTEDSNNKNHFDKLSRRLKEDGLI